MIINGKEYKKGDARVTCKRCGDEIRRIVVHSGKFHADDVLAAAMLLMIFPDAEVVRKGFVSNEYDGDPQTIVADIGFGKYDHHQPDAEVRPSGTRYAACGLLFRDFGDRLFDGDSKAAKAFERKYIIPIEITDNGGVENPLSLAISAFNPSWDSDEDSDEAFAEAVLFAQAFTSRELDHAGSDAKANEIVSKAFADSDGIIVELPCYLPWRATLIDTTAVYIVYPAQRGGYSVQAVPEKKGSRTPKKPLPKEWLGKMPKGCGFVHPALFVAAFWERDDALRAAKEAVKS